MNVSKPGFSRDLGIAPTAVGTVESVEAVGATPTSRLKKPNPHSKDLRKGRHSMPGQIYFITTVTESRQPVFHDFNAARSLVMPLKNEQQLGRADTLAFVIMPDHLHWLMALTGPAPLTKIMQSLKALSAKKIGRPIWQPGFHDHALRKEEDLKAAARYIIANPLRASLMNHIGDYPHWDAIWL